MAARSSAAKPPPPSRFAWTYPRPPRRATTPRPQLSPQSGEEPRKTGPGLNGRAPWGNERVRPAAVRPVLRGSIGRAGGRRLSPRQRGHAMKAFQSVRPAALAAVLLCVSGGAAADRDRHL